MYTRNVSASLAISKSGLPITGAWPTMRIWRRPAAQEERFTGDIPLWTPLYFDQRWVLARQWH